MLHAKGLAFSSTDLITQLNSTYFQVDDKYFQRNHGMAVGSPLSQWLVTSS
jgi:hypothetical protein